MTDVNNDYELLVTAISDTEELIFESILRNKNIPYMKKKKECGQVTGIIMGFSIFGTDFYADKQYYDEAAGLLEAYAQSVGDTYDETDGEPNEEQYLSEQQ